MTCRRKSTMKIIRFVLSTSPTLPKNGFYCTLYRFYGQALDINTSRYDETFKISFNGMFFFHYQLVSFKQYQCFWFSNIYFWKTRGWARDYRVITRWLHLLTKIPVISFSNDKPLKNTRPWKSSRPFRFWGYLL